MTLFMKTKVTPSTTMIGSIDHSRLRFDPADGDDSSVAFVVENNDSGTRAFPHETVVDGKSYRLAGFDGNRAMYARVDHSTTAGGCAWPEKLKLVEKIVADTPCYPDPVAIFEAASGSCVKHAAIKGHICGHDNGKPLKRIQKRNDPCCCGSGKKAKKCCVYFPEEKANDRLWS